MRSIWSKLALTALSLSLMACGSNDNSKPTLNEGPIEIVFPLGHSTTTSDSVTVKGTITEGVKALLINGVEADFTQSETFWFADVTVSEQGNTELLIAYENADAKYKVITNVSVERSTIYFQSVGSGKVTEFEQTLYINDTNSDSIFSINKDGSTVKSLWNYRNYKIEGIDTFNIEDDMKVSHDGTSIYLVIDGWNETQQMDVTILASLNINTGALTTLYGPESDGYQLFNTSQLAYMPSSGEAGQLILTHTGTNAIPNIFDLHTQTMTSMNIDALNDLTGGLVYTRIYSMSEKSDNILRIIGLTRPNNTWTFWSGEVDLAACDNELETCRLTTSSLKLETDFTGCISPINGSNLHSGTFHEASQRWIYSNSRDSYSELCALNLSDYSISSTTIETESDDYRNNLSYSGSTALLSISGQLILSADLPSTFDGSPLTFSQFNQAPTIGDENIALQTAREIRINNSLNHAYWMDRDLGKIHKLDLATWVWSTIFELDDEILEEGQIASRPNFRPEESALDEVNNILYLVSDSQKSIFTYNLESGDYEVVVAYDSEGDNPSDLYDIETIALDIDRGLLYIANERPFDATRTDETKFNLLAYNTTTGLISELSETTSIIGNSLQDNMKASYDMSFDSLNDRVLFYNSNSIDPIWSINVSNGERGIFSFDYENDWTEAECIEDASAELCTRIELINQPSLSNARGHEIDETNNRLLISSQNSDSVLSMDLTSGIVTNLSPEDFSYGPLLTSPKGIDIIDSHNVALVSDESIDGLFLVDLDTGQRVLIHNQ